MCINITPENEALKTGWILKVEDTSVITSQHSRCHRSTDLAKRVTEPRVGKEGTLLYPQVLSAGLINKST